MSPVYPVYVWLYGAPWILIPVTDSLAVNVYEYEGWSELPDIVCRIDSPLAAGILKLPVIWELVTVTPFTALDIVPLEYEADWVILLNV